MLPTLSLSCRVRRLLSVALLALGLSAGALAADGRAEPVGDPLVEKRVTGLAEQLRCLTCMGQSVADSQSGFSADMKREMREMIAAGKSDKDIMDFMVQRYGDFVLYKPPVKASTWLLWGGPFALLLLVATLLLRRLRQRAGMTGAALSEADARAATRLLGDGKGGAA